MSGASALTLYFEAGPLLDQHYTGIPQVAVQLARFLLADPSIEVHFFHGEHELPHELVRLALADGTGHRLRSCKDVMATRLAPALDAVALFSNHKTVHGLFAKEALVLHDLSVHCTPQFHSAETVSQQRERLHQDIATSDRVFCVSDATRRAASRYFPEYAERFVLCRNGTSVPEVTVQEERSDKILVVVLGTLEPRKNIASILELIALHPELHDTVQFVFPGRFGWGEPVMQLAESYGVAELVGSTIVFPGFISETAKHTLLAHADLAIYPSVYEGFGLPVMEAVLHGTPVVTTRSTSLQELDGPGVHYFSPFIEADLDHVLARLMPALKRTRVTRALREKWSWHRMYDTLREHLLDLAEVRA